VLALMTRIARKLDELGWTMRSGGAPGADTAFENGSTRKEIYLPWRGFNGRTECVRSSATFEAYKIAARHHPTFNHGLQSARDLLARNTHEVLGADCNAPSSFALTWTKEGSIGPATGLSGGTNQTIRVAYAYNVQVFNLKREDHRAEWEKFVG
jgi:hypothetical protein